jgi:hypothetical protein
MTQTAAMGRNTRPIRREPATHIFKVGQAVRLKSGFGSPVALQEVFHVTATLPARGGSFQYRIRRDDERHERMTTEADLEPVVQTTSGNANLIERTFNHG